MVILTFEGENFHKLVTNTIFGEKTFADCSLVPCQRMPRPQILQRKLLRIATNLRNSWKFYPSKVSCYICGSICIFPNSLYEPCIKNLAVQHSQWGNMITELIFSFYPLAGLSHIFLPCITPSFLFPAGTSAGSKSTMWTRDTKPTE